MRSNNSSSNGRVANRLGMSSLPGLRPLPIAPISMPSMPMEWLDAGSWRLPSGQALAEFALRAGFLAPMLLKTARFPESPRAMSKVFDTSTKPAGKASER